MAEIIDMPKLSDTMSVGTVVKWIAKEGDKLEFDTLVCEIETDKATMELKHTAGNGVLLKIYAAEGAQLPVGVPIYAVGKAGETAPAAGGDAPAAPAAEAPKTETAAPAPAAAASDFKGEIIEMPKLSDTMTVGTLVKWVAKEGDKLEFDTLVCEIETDKATMELKHTAGNGVLLKTYAKDGEQLPVGVPIYAVGKAGDTAPDLAGGKPAAAPADKPAEAAPAAPANPAAAAPAPSPVSGDGRVKASPLAKKVAADLGVNVAGVDGTGPGGRVVRADVEAAAKNPAAKAAPASGAAPAKPAAPVYTGPGIQEEKEEPVSTMRAVIARRLTESKTTVPHFYLELEVDAAPLNALRESLNARLAELPPEQGGIKFTVNDFILKATAEALRRVPAVNASWNGTSVKKYASANVAFGVAIDDGLVTPVVRDAHAKSLRQVALEAKELIGKARKKKLTPAEMSGSTFTVTNLGMFGINGFFGIINTPNAAILSVGATIAKPVVNAKGEIVAGHRMNLGLSVDHRVVDGADGAKFLQALKEILETPALMMV